MANIIFRKGMAFNDDLTLKNQTTAFSIKINSHRFESILVTCNSIGDIKYGIDKVLSMPYIDNIMKEYNDIPMKLTFKSEICNIDGPLLISIDESYTLSINKNIKQEFYRAYEQYLSCVLNTVLLVYGSTEKHRLKNINLSFEAIEEKSVNYINITNITCTDVLLLENNESQKEENNKFKDFVELLLNNMINFDNIFFTFSINDINIVE